MTKHWPQDRLERYWKLQKRARRVGLRLTTKLACGMHFPVIRGADDHPHLLTDLDEAEASILAAEGAGNG